MMLRVLGWFTAILRLYKYYSLHPHHYFTGLLVLPTYFTR